PAARPPLALHSFPTRRSSDLDPCVHRVFRPSIVAPGEAHLLAEYLRAAGYETAAFTEDAYLLAQSGFDRGFGTYVETTSVRTEGDRKSTRLNSSHVAISYAVF